MQRPALCQHRAVLGLNPCKQLLPSASQANQNLDFVLFLHCCLATLHSLFAPYSNCPQRLLAVYLYMDGLTIKFCPEISHSLIQVLFNEQDRQKTDYMFSFSSSVS